MPQGQVRRQPGDAAHLERKWWMPLTLLLSSPSIQTLVKTILYNLSRAIRCDSRGVLYYVKEDPEHRKKDEEHGGDKIISPRSTYEAPDEGVELDMFPTFPSHEQVERDEQKKSSGPAHTAEHRDF